MKFLIPLFLFANLIAVNRYPYTTITNSNGDVEALRFEWRTAQNVILDLSKYKELQKLTNEYKLQSQYFTNIMTNYVEKDKIIYKFNKKEKREKLLQGTGIGALVTITLEVIALILLYR